MTEVPHLPQEFRGFGQRRPTETGWFHVAPAPLDAGGVMDALPACQQIGRHAHAVGDGVDGDAMASSNPDHGQRPTTEGCFQVAHRLLERDATSTLPAELAGVFTGGGDGFQALDMALGGSGFSRRRFRAAAAAGGAGVRGGRVGRHRDR